MSNSVITPQTKFAFNLLRELMDENETSTVVSPVSISVSLGMLLLGAKDNTATEIQNALAKGNLKIIIFKQVIFTDVNETDIHKHFSSILEFVNGESNKNSLKMINKVYIKTGLNIHETYKNGSENYYDGQIELKNFVENHKVANVSYYF